jgi:DNA-binding transcriptional LysR family regulator
MQLPSIDSLRCFREAARFLNFTAAARAVGLTPAALGQRIRQLEDQLGAPLFHRTTRSVVLTEAGVTLLPYAEKTLSAAEDCVRVGRGEIAPQSFELVLGTRHELGLSWLVPLLPTLRASHPGMILHLYFGSGQDILARVRTALIDCAISSSRLTDPKLDALRLHEERYLFVASTALLARNSLACPGDAARHVLLDISADLPLFRYWRDAPGGIDSMRFAQVQRIGTIGAIRTLVLAGDGVAVLPEYFIRADLDAGRLAILLPEVTPLSDHFRLVFRSDDPRRAILASLAESLRAAPLH